MINQMLFDILKRKVISGEVKIEDIKNEEYKTKLLDDNVVVT
jgi:threonyl-tRNA synthetase